MKRKTLTVGLCGVHREIKWARSGGPEATVPMIRLRGHWLARAGFGTGQKMAVDVVLGTLSLTLTGRTPKTNYSVPEAQEVLGALAEKLEGIVRALNEVHDGLPVPELHDGTLEEEMAPDLAAEILGAIECIVADCLAPAIDSLAAVAKLTEEELERELWRERARMETARLHRAGIAPLSDQLELTLPPASAIAGELASL
ncbi:MAG TPA: SymE family type I addiction module toxin [Thermoanaerobaculia bacterium]|nr:SymE family type I addiction module toxin [Thermoanaerobaculia bacterium]